MIEEGEKKGFWNSHIEMNRDFKELPPTKMKHPETGEEFYYRNQKPTATHFIIKLTINHEF